MRRNRRGKREKQLIETMDERAKDLQDRIFRLNMHLNISYKILNFKHRSSSALNWSKILTIDTSGAKIKGTDNLHEILIEVNHFYYGKRFYNPQIMAYYITNIIRKTL